VRECADGSTFNVADLCHYCTKRDVNTDVWPNIGLQFCTGDDVDGGTTIFDKSGVQIPPLAPESLITILLPGATEKPDKNVAAEIYVSDSPQSTTVSAEQLSKLRMALPQLKVLDSTLKLPDQISLGELLVAYGEDLGDSETYFDYADSQEALRKLAQLKQGIPKDRSKISDATYNELRTIVSSIDRARVGGTADSELALLLFRDIIGVKASSIQELIHKGPADRGYVESKVTEWNQTINTKLNLKRYWQQDERFQLLLNVKNGMVYFEIEDRTNSKYTFAERSSGLKYFLSYYIQAKSLERCQRDRHCIAIMDEPDCFLSILGQRNLLEIFESLVDRRTSGGTCQMVYSTHSPFLINRNFPYRIRLLSKGAADEGTQYIRRSASRRFEPVRSALGVDCGQTLFVGSANVVVEGMADQFLIAEAIRSFCTQDNLDEFLDLNRVTFVSGESAESILTLVMGSQGGDLRPPVFLVLLDSDQGGSDTATFLLKQRGSRPLVDSRFVLHIGEVVGSADESAPIVTTEDLIPTELYARGVARYVTESFGDVTVAETDVVDAIRSKRSQGVAQATKLFFHDRVYPSQSGEGRDTNRSYDKVGVLKAVFDVIRETPDTPGVVDFRERTKHLCQTLDGTLEGIRSQGFTALTNVRWHPGLFLLALWSRLFR